ncbi:Ig-like domain-containing protein [Meridianimarinicoccus sp. MJW13]|uniref:Ig-like domain-containing protein n=1 Tax=Meridianimarinicoccus sp. MJW13 TaxID=2720031 RepID=UPI00186827F1|nr:Ig-like domain-containing protein [Fluviibacterium sp. MJW13]
MGKIQYLPIANATQTSAQIFDAYLQPLDASSLAVFAALLRQFSLTFDPLGATQPVTLDHAGVRLMGSGLPTLPGQLASWLVIGDPTQPLLEVLSDGTATQLRFSQASRGLDLTVASSGDTAATADQLGRVLTLLSSYRDGQLDADALATGLEGESVTALDSALAAPLAAQAAVPLAAASMGVNLVGDGSDETLTGTDFDDVIDARAGNDSVSGGLGNDTLIGGGGADTLYGEQGDDKLDGGFGNDLLFGGSQNDTLSGGDGNDQLFGNSGADIMDGGNNSDSYFVDRFDTVTDTGTAGYDKATIQDPTGVALDLTGWSGIERINGNDGDDTIDGSSQTATLLLSGAKGDDTLIGGTTSDALIGGEGDDTLVGGAGDDLLLGSTGNDTYSGGAGNDVLMIGEDGDIVTDGGAGNDKAVIYNPGGVTLSVGGWKSVERYTGYTGDDTIDATGGTTRVVLSGGDGDDTLTGSDVADTIYGGKDDDTLDGGIGDDLLVGGDGNDILRGGAGDDLLFGGAGNDTYTGGDGDDVMLIGEDGDTVTDGGAGNDKAIIYNAAGVSISVGSWLGVERISGYTGDDTIDATGSTTRFTMVGNGGNDRLIGGTKGDTIFAGDGDDNVSGGGGNDVLIGGAGNDTIEGGAGDDFLLGGAGRNTYVFGDGAGKDVVVGFKDGTDLIHLAGHSQISSLSDLDITQMGTHTVVRAKGTTAHQFTLADFDATKLTTADFHFGITPGGPAQFTVALKTDTGVSASDNITSDADLIATIQSTAAVSQVLVSLDGGGFVAISETPDATGKLDLTKSSLETALGTSLSDGLHTVHFAVDDANGARSISQALDFTFDTTAQTSTAALAPSSDTDPVGDNSTSLAKVKLVGMGEPGATVSDGTVSALVKNDGSFALSGVAVAKGANTITLTTTDAAGNASTLSLTITGVDPVASDTPVLTWNQIALDSIVDNAAGATTASRVLAMQSVAVYDVIAALDGSSAVMADVDAAAGANLAAAVSVASHAVLSYAFPAFAPELDTHLATSLAAIGDGQAKTDGMALGQSVASKVIAIRGQDGWDDFEPYPGSDVPGEWRETGPFYNTAVTPQYATMDPWSLQSTDQFRPGGPPKLTSQAYADAVAEVADIGARDSTTRTTDQSEAAQFWKDARGTETTPGHWNSIAADYLASQGLGSAENARTMAVLNIAMADAMIAAWDAKYAFDYWRPEDAIREADSDGNPATVQDATWNPYLFAPAHPEYVSGHGAASGAAAEILTDLFGTQSFSTESLGLLGTTRSFASYWEAAQENADSRLWGGVHYDFSNQDGLTLGQTVADWAMAAFTSTTDSAPPVIVVDSFPDYVANQPIDLTGAALDALSGLAGLTVSVNGGAPADVGTDAAGNFAYTLSGLADGQYDLAFRATDVAGNQSATLNHTVLVDSLPPSVTLTSTDANGDLSGIGARLTGTIDGTGSPVIALAYQIGGGTTVPISFNTATGAFDTKLNLSGVDAGDHTVTLIGVDAAGNSISQDIALSLVTAVPFVVTDRSPAEDATDVGSTFRPEVHFSRPVDATTLTSSTFYITDTGGAVLPSQVKLSADGLKAWLFPAQAMPGASKVTVHLDGDNIKATDGAVLDGDADGAAGGGFASSFSTVSTAAVSNTTITGYLVDPGNDLKPMTVDDYSRGPDGTDFTDDDVFKSPIEGAEVYILGLEQYKVTTDATGYFELTNVPSGNVKVALDGRTATNSPTGIFWPEMVMDATIIAGQENTLMAAQGTPEQRAAVEGRGEVYLPRVPSEILTDLSDTAETQINVPVSAAQDLTAEQRNAIQLVVQPGTAVDEHGDPVSNAQVGISTVPPELVMDMLPAGIMQHTFDLTIQAPDAAVFTTPAQLTLPNVFNAAPGTKLNLLSFDHTTGRLVIEGTGTVSADGKTVTTDPGTGITKPGWHGMTPPGGNGCNGGDPLQPDEEDPSVPDPMLPTDVDTLPLYNNDGAGGIRFSRDWVAPPPLDETPPNPGDEDCPEAAEDVNGKEQPWINVKIEIDGPLAAFADKEGNLGLANTEFTLRAGTNAQKGFAFSFKDFDSMFGAGGLKNIDTNKLYGSKITITERTQDENGVQTVTKDEIIVSRFVDATDDTHTGGMGGGEMGFAQTVNDGAGTSVRDVPLELIGVQPDLSIGTGTHYSLQNGNTVVRFDPTATADALTDTLDVSFTSIGGESAGTIQLSGKGAAPETYKLDTTTFESILAGMLNATNYPNLTATQKALIDTKAERDAILALIGTQTQKFFDDAGLEGISETTSGTGSNNISFLDGRSQISYDPVTGAIDGYGLGGATNAFAATDIDFDEIIKLYTERGNYNKYEILYRAAEVMNNTLGGPIAFYLDNFFIDSASSDTNGELQLALGHNSAHEIGHNLGLIHTLEYQSTGAVTLHAGGTDDVMAQGLYSTNSQSFDESLEAAMVNLHNTYTPEELLKALKYYNTINTTQAGYVTGINNQVGYTGTTDTGHDAFVQVDGPALDISLVDGTPVFGSLAFADAVIGGTAPFLDIEIQNYGSDVAVIDGITVDSGAFEIDALETAFSLQPGESRIITINFDPDTTGDLSAVFSIDSNATSDPYEVALSGTSTASLPTLRVTSDNSNIGGVDRGDTQSVADMFTITNDGLQDLVIDGIDLDATASAFDLVGVPTDLATNPITLATGDTFSFGVSFTGVAPGLERGAITISSNDPVNPVTAVAASATSFEGMHYFDWGNDFIAVDVAGDVLRTRSDDNGDFEVFMPADADYRITVFDPDSGLVARGYGTTSPSGQGTDLTSGLVFRPSTAPDRDFDGLAADIEHAVGTSDINADSNADGISDYNAVLSGIEALDPFSTNLGVVRTLALNGEVKAMFAARDQAADGSTTDPLLVLTATGLSVIDVTDPRAPTVESVTDIANVRDGDFDAALDLMVVVATDGTAHIWDLSDTSAPVDLGELTTGAGHVAARDGQAMISVSGAVKLFDLTTGDEIESISLGSNVASVRGLVQEGAFAYALDNRGTLHVIEQLGDQLLLRGSVSVGLSAAERKLFAGDGVVYVPASNGFQGGYVTVDVSNPDAPSVISGADDTSLGGNAIALNGAGRGLIVGDPGGAFGVDAIDVINTASPANTDGLITRYTVDSKPTDVLIAAGVGYVGAADGKLHIVNFQPFDTSGVAPQVSLVSADVDMDPATAGVQILEGSLISLDAMITDDAGLRSVSLLVDGDPIIVDLSYPFDLNARIPLLGSGETSRPISLQVRATDTGGNVGLSTLINAEIVPDTIPPMLVSSTLDPGALYGRSKRGFSFTFDEPLDPTIDLSAAFQLTGPSGVVAPASVLLRSGDRTVSLTYPVLEEGSYTMALVGGAITDVAGNATSATDQTFDFELGTFSNEWTGAAGDNLWGTAGNWTTGVVPDATDDVFVGNLTGEVVLQSLGDVDLKSLVAEAPLRISHSTRLATEFDALLDDVTLESHSAVLEIGSLGQIDILNLTRGTVDGPGTINIEEELNWREGTFGQGGLLTVENGALARFGADYDPEADVPYPTTQRLHRDLLLEGNGTVGAGQLRLGLTQYNPTLAQNETIGGRLTIAAGSELELTNFNSDIYLDSHFGGAGVENLGTLRKTGGGTSQAAPFNETLGQVVIEDGFVSIPHGATLRLTDQDDLTQLNGLKIDGGTLILDSDVTLGDFQMASGTVQGVGDLTLTGTALVTGGTFRGTGDIVVPDGETLQLGQTYDPEVYPSTGYITMARDLDVSGDVIHANANLGLGDAIYDSTTGQYTYTDTAITVQSSGVYTFSSPFADMSVNYPQQNTDSGLSNAGGIVKTGGGASGAAFFGAQTGTFDFRDGILEITDGTFTLTQALIDAGFDRLQIVGGTVVLDEDVTLTELTMLGGSLEGTGAATVQDMIWRGGAVSLTGGVDIPAGATATVDNPYYTSPTLATTLTVDGTLVFGDNSYFTFGTTLTDASTSTSTPTAGTVQVNATGVAEFQGQTSLYDGLNDGTLSGFTGTGTLRKTGSNISSLMVQDFAGTIDDPDSQFHFSTGTSTITQATLDGGLAVLNIDGATVLANEDLSIDTLSLVNGRLDGTGTVTITGQMDWTGGSTNGSGGLVIASGADVDFGEAGNPNAYLRYLYLGRDMTIQGTAEMGNANLYLGNQYYDRTTQATITQPGFLTVDTGGTLDFQNTSGDVRIYSTAYFAAGDAIGIVNLGAITASAGTQTTSIPVARHEGSITAADGRFQIETGVFEVDQATDGGIFAIADVVSGTVHIVEDVSLAELTMAGGTLDGPGDLSLTSALNWSNGTFFGDGKVILAQGANGVIGAGAGSTATLYLQRELVIAGDADMEGALLRLGTYVYDATQGLNINHPGVLTIDPTGTLRLIGDNANFSNYRSIGTVAAAGNQIDNNGQIIKDGGGISSVSNGVPLVGSGSYLTQDGVFEVRSGTTLVINGSVSLSHIRLNGGTLDVTADSSITDLEVVSGTVTGIGDLTVTGDYRQTGGTLTGTGALVIGTGASAQFGPEYTGDSRATNINLDVARDLTIQGTATIEQAHLRLGVSGTPQTGVDVTVAAGGTLNLEGAHARLQDYRSSAGSPNAVINNGTIQKTGDGIADIDATIALSGSGTVLAPTGQITTPNGDVGSFTPPAPTPIYADTVANGVTRVVTAADGVTDISVTGGVLQVNEDITLTNLSMTNGRIEGTGVITITGRLDWQGGEFRAGGEVIVAAGAQAVLGELLNVEAPIDHGSLYLGRTLTIAGSAVQEQATLRLGSTQSGPDTHGILNITGTGSYEAREFNSDILRYRDASDGTLSEIILDGSFTKTGAGQTRLNGLPISGTGTLSQTDTGTLYLENMTSTLDSPGATLTGDIAVSGGRFVIDADTDLSGLTSLHIINGTLVVSGDVSLAGLILQDSTLQVIDTLTVTGSYTAYASTVTGGGELIVDAGASAEILSNRSYTTNHYLGVTLTVDGDLAVDNSVVRLGEQHYDSAQAQYVSFGGRVDVGTTGTLTLHGDYGDIVLGHTVTGVTAEVAVDGTLIKEDGGTSDIHALQLGTNATVQIVDGVVRLTGGTLDLTQAMVDAGLTDIALGGGELVITEDISLNSLSISGGTLSGDGDLTIITALTTTSGGTLSGGDIIIADTAKAELGSHYYSSLGRNLTVHGEAEVTSAMYLGVQTYDSTLGQYVYTAGALDVSATGTLRVSGSGSIYLAATPPAGTNWGVTSAGTIVSEVSELTIPLLDGSASTYQLNNGVMVHSTGDLLLTQAMVDAGLTSLKVTNGTVTVDEDVTLPRLDLSGGEVRGTGTLTVSQDFDWIAGTMSGTGVTHLADTADVLFGYDHATTSSSGHGFLTRTLEIEGDADLGNMSLQLGQRGTYDSTLNQYNFDHGVVSVLGTGTLTINGNLNSISRRFAGYDEDDSGVANAGAIVKTGGGTTAISLLSNTGTFDFQDGILTLSGGELTYSQALIDAGFTEIVVQSGTFTVSEALSVDNLTINGGTLVIQDDLTVLQNFDWQQGTVETGDATLTIADTATAAFGQPFDPENPYNSTNLQLRGDMDVAGTADFGSVQLYLGQTTYNSQIGQYDQKPGTLDILSTGVLTMDGPRADIFVSSYNNVVTTGVNVGVNVQGTLAKINGGSSEVPLYGDNTSGTFQQGSGQFALTAPWQDSGLTEVVLTPEMVANGLDHVRVEDAVLYVGQDLSVGTLELADNAALAGPGDVTVTGGFDISDASLLGTGDLILETGSVSRFGEAAIPDQYDFAEAILIAQTVEVRGTAIIEQADMLLGGSQASGNGFFDTDAFQFVTDLDTAAPGNLVIADTGTVEFFGPQTDFELGFDAPAAAQSGISNAGTILKSGSGTTTIDTGISFDSTGIIQVIGGSFDAPGTVFDFGI